MVIELPAIPVRDVRDGGPVRHAIEAIEVGRALRDDCLSWLPPGVRHAMPILDGITRRWLMRSQSPYIHEITAISAALGFSGIWFLNGSYQWGCTARARDDDAPWLVRTLDWPFPGLGRHVEIARMAGQVGEFYSVTWPGFVGVLTGMAPGRFAASINQAPMWRRTRQPWLRPFDMMANAAGTWAVRHMPPDQLLRHVFETAPDFASAREQLERTPIARPVIYTLAGSETGQRCVIERTVDGFTTRIDDTGAANDWLVRRRGWEGRIGADVIFTCSHDEAGANSQGRRAALTSWQQPFVGAFDWVVAPVLNRYTRMAVEACPARGILRVVGYESVAGSELPQRATLPREVAGLPLDGRVTALAS
jgi:hypothetical protein